MARHITPKGENSRQQIIQAAYSLFLKKGYHATSIRDISERCGLTIGGVYTHFPGKESIFTAVLDEYNPLLKVMPVMLEAQGDTLDALLHDMARRMVSGLGLQRDTLNLIFIEVVEFEGRHFEDLFPKVFPLLIEGIERITRQEQAIRQIPLPVLGRSFFGLFFSYFMTHIILARKLPFDDTTLDAFVDIYLYGILERQDIPSGNGGSPDMNG